MNTTEYTVFRRPNIDGVSQELGVSATNPLAGKACGSGGARYRGIGTGEVVGLVQNSNADFGTDGIAYAFFSYGNISSIANSSSYGYLQLNSVDGIFAKYTGGDPGEPGKTELCLPLPTSLPLAEEHSLAPKPRSGPVAGRSPTFAAAVIGHGPFCVS